jgi:RNA polymerase sigma-70 factor (ECF subfamily)
MDEELSKRWPGIAVPLDEFEAWAAERASPAERRADLYLAFACSRSDPQALAALDAELMPRVAAAVVRFGDADFVKEVCQQVRQKLLLAAGGAPPKIAEYRGRGPLLKFLQAVAVRTALNLIDAGARDERVHDDAALLDLPGPGDDAELLVIKSRYREEFKAAFTEAMSGLEDQLRTALRLHYLDGLTLGDLSQLYGWSVPTASRRLAAARERVLDATRRHMCGRLQLTPAELDSVLRLIESRLTIDTLSRGPER